MVTSIVFCIAIATLDTHKATIELYIATYEQILGKSIPLAEYGATE